ncbi:hypothetical protein LEP1GSC047_3876 [Leptospira inadai serovar Lyme str. 10]|uniref:Uncharacterized protein n=2 Tax=Leptospira inadai serovar Lyme TaxID=293084 RepID=V6HDG9_9LEPT|nr:hypothetical protein LEP1GSC047_3876 [Leptospira inadai serovar Lyme str. 10]PNV76321.1 hypothetical protein BES34_004810 [Leptospira inadai serovar Lyme]
MSICTTRSPESMALYKLRTRSESFGSLKMEMVRKLCRKIPPDLNLGDDSFRIGFSHPTSLEIMRMTFYTRK